MHIMTLSGQKSETGQKSQTSIRSYSRNVSDNMRRDLRLTLSTHMRATNVVEQATLSQTTTVSDLELHDSLDIPSISSVKTPVFNITNCNVTIKTTNFYTLADISLSFHCLQLVLMLCREREWCPIDCCIYDYSWFYCS